MITIASCLWDVNEHSEGFSRCYDESWAEKLYRGFRRNLSLPFEFVLFTDRLRSFREPAIQQRLLRLDRAPDYGSCVEPFSLDRPMIFVGLDTIILKNIDKLARWALEHPGALALPKHPYEDWSINGVVLFGGGNPAIFRDWCGENDMKWMRSFPHQRIDELWKGKVVSYKAHAARGLPPSARIVYFHGNPKPNELSHLPWVKESWR